MVVHWRLALNRKSDDSETLCGLVAVQVKYLSYNRMGSHFLWEGRRGEEGE